MRFLLLERGEKNAKKRNSDLFRESNCFYRYRSDKRCVYSEEIGRIFQRETKYDQPLFKSIKWGRVASKSELTTGLLFS